MRVFTVTCDDRPAAVVRASDAANAVDIALDLAQRRNLLGFVGLRRFAAREPLDAEMVDWLAHHVDHLILDQPVPLG